MTPRRETSDGDEFVITYLWIWLYNERDGAVFLELSRPTSMAGKKIWSSGSSSRRSDLALGAFS